MVDQTDERPRPEVYDRPPLYPAGGSNTGQPEGMRPFTSQDDHTDIEPPFFAPRRGIEPRPAQVPARGPSASCMAGPRKVLQRRRIRRRLRPAPLANAAVFIRNAVAKPT